MMKPAVLIVATGVVASALIGYNAVYAPQERQVRVIEATISQERVNQATRADVATLLTSVEQYRKRLPREPSPSWIVHEAVTLSHQAGVQLATISQAAAQPYEQFTRLSVDIHFRASYHQLGSFLDAIENASSFLFVDHLEILESHDSGDQATMHLALGTLYVPPLRGEPSS